jgi:hypothetical protein
VSNDLNVLTLRTLLGDYPNTLSLKSGEIRPSGFVFDFADVKVPNTAFKDVVRHLKYDVAELAIVTYLQARAHGKPLALLPAVVVGTMPHPFLVYNAERDRISPADLKHRRVGIRAYSVTTATWVRGILQNDHAVDLDSIKWVTFEDPHVAEYQDPATAERAPAGKQLVKMLLGGSGRRPRSQRVSIAAGDSRSQRGGTSLVPTARCATDQSYGRRQRVAEKIQPSRHERNLPRAARKQTSSAGARRSRHAPIRSGKCLGQFGADYRILSATKADSETVRSG